MNKTYKIISIIFIVFLVILITMFFVELYKENHKTKPDLKMLVGSQGLETLSQESGCPLGEEDLDPFAKCLAEKNITMYGAEWCSHCQEEKKLFGESFQYVPYVECPEDINACLELGIEGYPTWIFHTSTTSEQEVETESEN